MTARRSVQRRRRRSRTKAATVVLAVGLSLTSSVWAASSESASFYNDAVTRLERNDLAGAIIQLNNAIQRDPNLLAAHVLLGKTRLRNGDPAGAEASLEKALRLGVDRAEVALPLAEAYVAQRKYDLLLERVMPDGLPKQTKVQVLILRGNAQAEKENGPGALRAFEEARSLDPQSIPVRLALVNALIRMDESAKAIAVLDETVKLAPNDSAVWNLRGYMAHVKGDLKQSLEYYAKAIALDPKNLDALVAQAGLLLDTRRLDDADKALANLDKVAPNDPHAAYLRAVAASHRNNAEGVRSNLEIAATMLDRVPKDTLSRHPQLLLIGGLAHHGLGHFEKAAQYLTLYVKGSPRQLGPSKLLAGIWIDRGEVARAIELLGPLLQLAPNDPQLLSLLAAAHMAERRYTQAANLLEKAVSVSGGTPEARIDFGVSLIANGQANVGFTQLQQAFAKDPGNARAGMVMATLYLRREQPKKALEILDVVVRREPKNFDAVNLQGIARVAAGDGVGGRAAYQSALAMNPKSAAVQLNVARLDLAEGKSDAARAGLSEFLKNNPKHGDAMMEFARLEEQTGRPAEAVKWLESAMVMSKYRVQAGIQLSSLLIRQRDFERALNVAKDASSRAPNDMPALFALTRAQLETGDIRAARLTLNAMSPLAGFDPSYNLEIARLQIMSGDRENAYHSLDKALHDTPDFMPALDLAVEMEIAAGNYARAQQYARLIAERYPTRGLGLRLLGDLAATRRQYSAAIGHFQASLGKEKSPDTVIRLYRTYTLAGENAKAVAFLDQASHDYPADKAILRALADSRSRAGNLAGARSDYERLLQINPFDVEVLNNLAQVAMRQEDNAALGYAERAYQLASTRPAVLDTFGWVLVRYGQLERGTSLLRDARLRDSTNPEIRYHLAAALAQSGRESEARTELKEGLKGNATFDEIEDARKLQKKLGN